MKLSMAPIYCRALWSLTVDTFVPHPLLLATTSELLSYHWFSLRILNWTFFRLSVSGICNRYETWVQILVSSSPFGVEEHTNKEFPYDTLGKWYPRSDIFFFANYSWDPKSRRPTSMETIQIESAPNQNHQQLEELIWTDSKSLTRPISKISRWSTAASPRKRGRTSQLFLRPLWIS